MEKDSRHAQIFIVVCIVVSFTENNFLRLSLPKKIEFFVFVFVVRSAIIKCIPYHGTVDYTVSKMWR